MSLNSKKNNTEEELNYLRELTFKLDRIISYLHVLSLSSIRNLAREVLNSEEKIKVYLACDGGSGIREISRKLNIPHQTVSNYVRKFEKCGLVSSRIHKKSKCPERLYELDELGLEVEDREKHER